MNDFYTYVHPYTYLIPVVKQFFRIFKFIWPTISNTRGHNRRSRSSQRAVCF